MAWLDGKARYRHDGTLALDRECVAVEYCCQHDLGLGESEDRADTNPRTSAEGQICATRCPGRWLSGKSVRHEGRWMLPVLAMAMQDPGRNINLNAAPHWFPHNHIIFDRLAHQEGNRRVEPQSPQQHEA